MAVCDKCQLVLDELQARSVKLEQEISEHRIHMEVLIALSDRMAEKGEPVSKALEEMYEKERKVQQHTYALRDGYKHGAIANFKCIHQDHEE
ncbi:hypothetical protein PG985_005269 [Apiospora marii]|uniref:Uncharacterized protein n=1 Tax=Apiospora marii TaxID=335849 RepID=A0ABR1SBN8_9PEZI